MTETATNVSPPPDLTYGYVDGRIILAIGDRSDAGRMPDPIPAEGLTVTLTPANTILKVTSPTPATVIKQPIVCGVDANGYLVDGQGARGVWLVAGVYKVTYSHPRAMIPSHDIDVTTGHTEAAPLDLTTAMPPGGPVLTPSEYAELNGRITILEAGGGGGGVTAHAATHAAAGSDPVTLTSAQISDLTETVQDIVGAFIVAGTNVTITPNDGADTITIAASGGGGGGGNLVAYGAPYATLVNVIGRAGGSVLAAATDRLTSHYNAESFTCDAIGLVHRSGNTTATYRLAIWSGAPNPALVFKTPEFSTGAGESIPLFTVAPGTVFPRGVWYVGLFLTSGTSGNFGGGARDVRMEPQRDVNNSGAFSFNLGTIAPGWEPPSAITPIGAWGSGSMPQLIAQNVRPA